MSIVELGETRTLVLNPLRTGRKMACTVALTRSSSCQSHIPTLRRLRNSYLETYSTTWRRSGIRTICRQSETEQGTGSGYPTFRKMTSLMALKAESESAPTAVAEHHNETHVEALARIRIAGPCLVHIRRLIIPLEKVTRAPLVPRAFPELPPNVLRFCIRARRSLRSVLHAATLSRRSPISVAHPRLGTFRSDEIITERKGAGTNSIIRSLSRYRARPNRTWRTDPAKVVADALRAFPERRL